MLGAANTIIDANAGGTVTLAGANEVAYLDGATATLGAGTSLTLIGGNNTVNDASGGNSLLLSGAGNFAKLLNDTLALDAGSTATLVGNGSIGTTTNGNAVTFGADAVLTIDGTGSTFGTYDANAAGVIALSEIQSIAGGPISYFDNLTNTVISQATYSIDLGNINNLGSAPSSPQSPAPSCAVPCAVPGTFSSTLARPVSGTFSSAFARSFSGTFSSAFAGPIARSVCDCIRRRCSHDSRANCRRGPGQGSRPGRRQGAEPDCAQPHRGALFRPFGRTCCERRRH